LREENSFIEELTDKAMEKCQNGNKLVGLSDHSGVIRKRCIARLLVQNKLPYSRQRLEEIDNIVLNSGKLNISRDIFLVSQKGELSLETITKPSDKVIQKEMVIGENIIFSQCSLVCELLECDNLKKIEAVHKKSTFYLIDYDKIRGRVVVRSRKFGDKIQLKGRNFSSSVKKLINEKILPSIRPTLHFLEDEDGTIYAEGIGVADRVAIDNETSKFLMISVKRS
jgi:tRNA(Ile)-lysidine synthase